MATVVDSLVVTLGLDPKNFTQGAEKAKAQTDALRRAVVQSQAEMAKALGLTVEQFREWTAAADRADAAERRAGENARSSFKKTRDESARTAKEMQAGGDKAAEFFGKIKVEALSLIGILLGGKGIETFIRDTTRDLSDLGRQALNIGEAAGPVEAFAMAIARMGGNADNARGMLQRFAESQSQFKLFGQGNFGVDMALIGGNLDTSPLEAIKLFQAFIDRTKGEAGGIQKINTIGKDLFGFDQSTLNAMIQIGSVANLNKELGESLKLGVPTQEMIQRATDFQIALTRFGQAAKFDGEVLLNDLYPALTAFLNALTGLIEQNPKVLAGLGALVALWATLAGLKTLSSIFSVVGITSAATAIDGLALSLGRLLALPGLAAFLAYEGFHISGAGAGEDAELQRLRKAHGMNPDGSGGSETPNGSGAPLADATMTPEQQAFLQTLSGPESGGDYNIKNGGDHFSDLSRFPEGVGSGGTSTAAGRYQFTSDTWKEVSQALGLHDFSPASQDRGAWYLADREYRTRTGRDLQSDLKAGGHDPEIATALKGRWPSLPGGSQYHGIASGSKITPIFGGPTKIPAPPPPAGASRVASNNNTTHTTIGNVNVHTQATDANGIAQDMNTAIVTQANRGAS